MELEKQKLEAEIRLAELRAQGGAAVDPPDPALDTTQDGVGATTRAPGSIILWWGVLRGLGYP